MLKRILTPIIYGIFLIPILIADITVLSIIEQNFGYSSFFGRMGSLEALVSTSIISILIFSLANIAMQKVEGTSHPRSFDHFRQSILYYIATIPPLIMLLRSPNFLTTNYGLEFAFACLILFISLWAIMVNAIFLYLQNKKSITRI